MDNLASVLEVDSETTGAQTEKNLGISQGAQMEEGGNAVRSRGQERGFNSLPVSSAGMTNISSP